MSAVAVLRSSLPVFGSAANPEAIRAQLARRGIKSRLISESDLGQLGDAEAPAVIVLPAAASFPLAALPALRRFLRGGGHMVALGGYAFSRLFAKEAGDQWVERTTISESLIPCLTEAGWRPSDPGRCSIVDSVRGGRPLRAFRMEVSREALDEAPGDALEPGAEWSCDTAPFEQGATYVLTAAMRSEGVGGRHFAHFHWTYLRIEQSDSSGAVLHSALLDFEHPYLTGSEEWRDMAYRFWPDPKAVRLVVKIGIKPGAYGTLWAADVALRRDEWPTTAVGMLCDGLHVLPHQLGCFDPSFRLEDACRIVTADGQGIVTVAVNAAVGLEGFAAEASTGEEPPLAETHIGHPRTVRRLTRLLESSDAHGRPRGAVMSIVHNVAGFYENSMWAFMGVENADLFGSIPAVAEAVGEVVDHMVRGVFLSALSPSSACYRAGECVSVAVQVRNRGHAVREVIVRCEIIDRTGTRVWAGERPGRLAGGTGAISITFACGAIPFASDLYAVTASVHEAGREIDRMRAGFAAWKPELHRAGRDIDFAGNYFRLDRRPTLLCGTKGGVFWLDNHLSEDPLSWDAECATLRDNALCVYGMVGLSQWITLDMEADVRERMLRRLDARVQLCHVHGIVPFIDLQFHPVAGVDRRAEIAYAGDLAERYRGLRSLFFYVTGDINIPLSEDPEMQGSFRRFLEGKYGSDRALADAWDDPGARIRDARVQPMKAYWHRKPWQDVRAADLHEFRNEFLRAWLATQAAGLREVAAGEGARLITAEFWSDQQLDQWNASTGLDFSAMGIGLGQRRYMHQYDAPMLRLADMRMAGQSFTIGEFGTQVHPAFDHAGYSWSDAAGKLDRFSMVVHHAFGLGGSMIATWDAADLDYYIFPWGLLHPDRRVPKRILAAYRNLSLFFRRLRPAWRQPEVLLVLPDENRRSGNFHVVTEALFNAARLLLRCRVDFAVINDGALSRVTVAPRALFYPIPFCPSDDAVSHLRRLAEAGSHLYISGDISLDPLRRRTPASAARLPALAGVRFARELRRNIDRTGNAVRVRAEGNGRVREYTGKPCIEVEQKSATVTWRTAEGRPVAFRHPLGTGSVSFSTDPIELFSVPEDATGNRERREVYGDILELAGVRCHDVESDEDVESFRLPLEDGGEAFIFYCNRPDGGPAPNVRLRHGGAQVAFGIGPSRGAAVVFDPSGKIVGWEGRGVLCVDGTPWLEASDDVLVYSPDSASLVQAGCLVVLPLAAGSLRWHRTGAASQGFLSWIGEAAGGAWRMLHRLEVHAGDGSLLVRWTSVDSRAIVLIGTEEAVAAGSASVVGDLHR